MKTCSYCRREGNDAQVVCKECGTEFTAPDRQEEPKLPHDFTWNSPVRESGGECCLAFVNGNQGDASENAEGLTTGLQQREGPRSKGMRVFFFILIVAGMALKSNASEGVVLLHGLCRSSGCMRKMSDALNAAGFVVENSNYPSRTAGIESLSDSAIAKAMNSATLKECSKIHFVAHSLGGILVRSYFKRHKDERLGRVVMLGPPNGGSEVVDRLGSWWIFRKINGPAGLELGTNPEASPSRLGPVDFELGVIAGDRSINWINSLLMINGRDDGKVSVERTKVAGMKEHVTIHVSHPYLMKSPAAIAYTVRFLREGFFRERPGK